MGDDMITEGMLDMFIFETEQGLENLENICLESKDVGEFDEDNVVNIDGEAIFTKKAELRLLPKAARLIVPAGMHFFDESLKTAGAMG